MLNRSYLFSISVFSSSIYVWGTLAAPSLCPIEARRPVSHSSGIFAPALRQVAPGSAYCLEQGRCAECGVAFLPPRVLVSPILPSAVAQDLLAVDGYQALMSGWCRVAWALSKQDWQVVMLEGLRKGLRTVPVGGSGGGVFAGGRGEWRAGAEGG